ncbi:Drug/metabolite transporter superfamily protein [Perilla frutescens var. hirtella]|uniref:Probable purine permease n=1 Tax=Perilla frutescens var. hirtella TaxID=608512 RepID=A0AAD4J2F1_PERFH|nr:Drug/metabolite transporter superfamily protein [Perilla frutescens var. hirtella]
MGEAQELHPEINGPNPPAEAEAEISQENSEIKKKSFLRQYKWWLEMIVYSFFLLGGQAVGTLLGRIYYDNGGKSNWMATLVQVVGFPVLIPFQLFTPTTKVLVDTNTNTNTNKRLPLILAAFYLAIGVFLAVDCMLYSIGLQYLPVTTYTLICATQLGFNALFSFFLNRQKFTPYIINSLVLLTISSTLLVFVPDSDNPSNKISKKKYIVGFICTVAASAGYAIMLSLTQLAFQKLIKKETIRAVVDMTVYQNLVATFVIIIGLFASGDWKKLNGEMEGFTSGKVSYIMNLFWTAVSWQVFGIGCVGLIFKISSLFSNVISILGLPMAPVLAVIFLGDSLTGLKAVSMLLAMWGFVSYIYQHYLDDLKMKEEGKREKAAAADELSLVALVNERGSQIS